MNKLCFVFLFATGPLISLPTGFQPVEGELAAPILDADGSLVIKSGEKGSASWDSFSIRAGEHVRFEQASVNSSFLNRVIGNEASELLGSLSSNGAIYLINPNGILIGPHAEIEAASFIGSTLDILNSDFLEERALAFQGDSEQGIVNQGRISCKNGDIFLIARAVENSGEIFANRVGIATGSEVLIQPKGEAGVYIRTALKEGLIQEMEEGSVYSKAIRHDGTIEAFAFEERGGEIYLVAADGIVEVEGNLIAKNEEGLGGTVHVLGDHVHILDESRVDVSGEFGGGTILLGGDYQGKNQEIKNAKVTWVGQDTDLKADALGNGYGGKIILWSDEATAGFGKISVQGGSLGGDGGLVEISSKGMLDVTGVQVSALAPLGTNGRLLFDPSNVTISGGATANGTLSACPGSQFTTTADNAVLNVTDLTNNLASCSVEVLTTPGGTQSGNITVSSAISWSATTTLTLHANANLTVSAAIDASGGGGSIFLQSDGAAAGSYNGINVAAALTTSTGDITLQGVAGTTGGIGANITAAITAASGTLSITATGGAGASNNYGILLAGPGGGVVAGTTGGAGSIALSGTGGGGGAGSANHGIFMSGGSLTAGADAVSTTTVTLTGVGGTGSGGGHRGVNITGGGITHEGNGAFRFSNCSGGTGGSSNFGVSIAVVLITPTGATGSVIFENITGGSAGQNNFGVYIPSGTVSATTITATNITGGPGTVGNRGFLIDGGTVGGGASQTISITATGGTGASATFGNYGIQLNAGKLQTGITDGGGSITLIGTGGGFAGPGGFNNQGIYLTGTGELIAGADANSTTTVTLTGVGGTGTHVTGSHYGVNLEAGTITHRGNGAFTFSNCSGGTGSVSNFGVNIAVGIAPTGATGSIVFTNISGGSASTNNYGVRVASGITISAATITATTNITGGAGTNGNIGFYVNNGTVSSTTSCTITATGAGTGTGNHGILVDGASGRFSTSSAGTITLNGTSSATSTGTSHGVFLSGGTGSGSGVSSTGSGLISITGTVPMGATGTSVGVLMASTNGIASSTGPITISGTSNATGASSHGFSNTSSWTTGTSGIVTFATCSGGSGATSHGINVGAAFSTSGNVVATTSILSGTGSGSVGFLQTANFATTGSGATIDITASSQATAGAAHGISFTGGAMSSTTGAITLRGTSGISTDTASYGISIATVNAITSTSGGISLRGQSTATFASSHGVNIGASWTTGTSGTVTFTTSNGGSGATSHGINVGAAFSTSGNVVATTSILSGTGSGSVGFLQTANFATTGSGATIDITASSQAILGAAHGISLTGGAMSSTTGAITLRGTSGISTDTASYGISIATANAITSTSGGISLRGQSLATFASSHGVNIGASWTTGTSGTVTFTTSNGGSGATSHGINVGAAFSTSGNVVATTSILSGTGDNSNGFNNQSASFASTGGSISITATSQGTSTASYGIFVSGASSTIQTANGALTLDGTPGAGTIYGIRVDTSGTVRSTGSGSLSFNPTSTAVPVGLGVCTISSGSGDIDFHSPVVLLDSPPSITTGGTGSVTFDTTINGISAGGQALTITAGSAPGAVVFDGNVGATTRLGALTISAGSGELSIGTAVTDIIANSVTVAGTVPTVLNNVGTLTVNTSAAGGNISFGGTINGATAGVQDLTLIAGAGSISNGAIGGTTRLGDLLVTSCDDWTSAGIIAASITQTAGTGTTTFNGALNTNTATGIFLSPNVNAVTFSGTVTTTSAGPVTVTNAGLLTINTGANMNLDGAFTQNGVGLVSIGADITTSNDNISFATGVTLIGNVILNTGSGAGDVTFTQTVNGAFGLQVLAGTGTVLFNQTVGATVALQSLQVSGASIEVNGAQTVQSGPMTYTGPVTLLTTGNFVDTGATGITFTSTITGNFDLTLQATSSNITVLGDVDISAAALSGSAGGALLVTAGTGVSMADISTQGGSIANGVGGTGGSVSISTSAGSALFSGQILTQGGNATIGTGGLGRAVSITASGGSVSVHNINTSGGTGSVQGGNAGAITLQPTNATSGGLPDGVIILNSDLAGLGNLVASGGAGATDGTGADVTLSAGRASATTAATITSSFGGNDVTIYGNRLIIGSHEAMTVLGNALFELDTSVTLSDTVVLEDLTIISPIINLLTHGDINILDYLGGLQVSPSLHFLSGGAYTQIGIIVPSGPVNAGTLGLSSAAFRPLLLLGSTILNYDDEAIIIPTTVVNPGFASRTVYLLTVADAELTDRLPIFDIFPYAYPKICSKINQKECKQKEVPYFLNRGAAAP